MRRFSPFKPFLPSQSEAFSRHQTRQAFWVPSQLPWLASDQPSELCKSRPLMAPNASTLPAFSSKHSCLNVSNTRLIISSNGCYCQPALIATPRYVLVKTTNQRPLILARLIIQPITPHRVNHTNQIFLTAAIKKAKKKRYINLKTKRKTTNPKAFTQRLKMREKKSTTPMRALTR